MMALAHPTALKQKPGSGPGSSGVESLLRGRHLLAEKCFSMVHGPGKEKAVRKGIKSRVMR